LKDELINALWPNVIVGDESLSQCISDVRHAVDDPHRHGRRIIKTVHGRGYLFDSPVSVQPPRSRPVDAFARAILAADVVGYSRLIVTDESGTLEALKAIRVQLFDPAISAHEGRLVKTTGGGLFVEFASVVNALRCATQLQQRVAERNESVPAGKRIEFRMGIHQGDVVVEDGDIFGGGVIVAARLERLAEPGSIYVSARVQEDATGKLDLMFEDMGEQQLKNIFQPVRIYRVWSADTKDFAGVFARFRLYRSSRRLYRLDQELGEVPVRLGNAAFDLLRLLVEQEGKSISGKALKNEAWPGRDEDSLDDNLRVEIDKLRGSLGENAQNSCIRLEPKGGGYRYVSPESVGQPSSVSPPPLPLPDKPSIAVLPFANMSGDPEQEYFADGMVEEIITTLSRIRWLFVIARTSTFSYKGHTVDVKQVGPELGVRYVLEGSVRKGGNRVRITAQLIDAINGAHLWADRFEGSLEEIFELQDQVANSVAGVIEPTLQAAEVRRSAEPPTSDLTAYDLYLRALALGWAWERNASLQALQLLEQAIERDPRYGSALVAAAFRQFEIHVNGWSSDDPEIIGQKGIEFARRALRVAGDDPNVLCMAAFVLGYFGEDIDIATALLERALKFNPNHAKAWQCGGWLWSWAGQSDLAIRHFETALRLNPREHRSNPFMGIGVAHFFAGRYENARAMLLLSLQERPNWVPTYRFLASCYAHMGRLDEARETVRRLQNLTNTLMPSATNWRNAKHRELFLSGLRLAMGEVT
jgi:TolB-like protein/class 3 adenylate cyclase/Flp pilus assembly protein TadD